MLPASPEMNESSVPVSGNISPMSGLGTPVRIVTPAPPSSSLNAMVTDSGTSTPRGGGGNPLTVGKKVNVNPST